MQLYSKENELKRLIPALVLLLLLNSATFSQTFNTLWNSGSLASTLTSGFFDFQKINASTWKSRLYAVDSTRFQVMADGYSLTPQYTYTFNAAEKLAGGQMYSLGIDLTGDGITEFYALAYNGTATAYRQSFKIINIVTGAAIFEKNDAAWYYSYPTFYDINADGLLEMIVAKSEYPYQNRYFYDVFSTGVSGINENDKPASFKLLQNYPNPFNPQTEITYDLSASGPVNLSIYDIQGALIKTLESGVKDAGMHKVQWDGTDNRNSRVPTGIYFYTLKAAGSSAERKMVMLK